MADRVFIAFPGLGALALTREQFEAALNAGRELAAMPVSGPPPSLPPSGNEPDLLDAEQLEEKTGVPKSWWMTQARERRIPFRKIGRRVRFAFDEVLACEAFKRHALSVVNSPQQR
jgi:hypothetical protein